MEIDSCPNRCHNLLITNDIYDIKNTMWSFRCLDDLCNVAISSIVSQSYQLDNDIIEFVCYWVGGLSYYVALPLFYFDKHKGFGESDDGFRVLFYLVLN